MPSVGIASVTASSRAAWGRTSVARFDGALCIRPSVLRATKLASFLAQGRNTSWGMRGRGAGRRCSLQRWRGGVIVPHACTLWPNQALNRTRRARGLFFRASVAAGRLA